MSNNMRRITFGAGVVFATLVIAQAAISASAPPPPPGSVAISNVSSDTKRSRFTIEWTPALQQSKAPYLTYQFATAPKYGCKYTGAPAGPGNFPTATYAATGPFKVSVECNCGYRYTGMVATAPPDAYTGRSKWINSPAVATMCEKP